MQTRVKEKDWWDQEKSDEMNDAIFYVYAVWLEIYQPWIFKVSIMVNTFHIH